jgi:hypothetical protein
MNESTGKFRIHFSETKEVRSFDKERILLGRLETCDIVLDDPTVSRVHAGITFFDERYVLANLSKSNVLTLNGRLLASEESDILTDGDTIQIGPFAILVGGVDDAISLNVQYAVSTPVVPRDVEDSGPPNADSQASWTTSSRSSGKSERVKKKTGDRGFARLRNHVLEKRCSTGGRPAISDGRGGSGCLSGRSCLSARSALSVFSITREHLLRIHLRRAHASTLELHGIASASNGNSCTTCHTPNEPVENSCVRCHQGSEFHSSNTRAHEDAGVTCTICHQEHQERMRT